MESKSPLKVFRVKSSSRCHSHSSGVCVTGSSCASFLCRTEACAWNGLSSWRSWQSPCKKMVTRVYAFSGIAFCVLALVILAILSLSTISDFRNIAVWADDHVSLDVSGTESSEKEMSHTIMVLMNSMAAMNSTAVSISSQKIGEKLIAVTKNMTVPEKSFPPFWESFV